jgi:hypothetical protein
MMIKWLVQDVGINMVNLQWNFEALKRLDFPFGNFGLITHERVITNLEEVLEKDWHYIIRGGTKILVLLDSIQSLSEVNAYLSPEQLACNEQFVQRLKDAVFYDVHHFDQAYYSTLDLPLLNTGAKLYEMTEHLDTRFNQDMFIKPSRDLKAFDAGILPQGTSLQEYVLSGKHQKIYLEEKALIAPVKVITAEYRFFVVEGEVVTGSQYRLGGMGVLNASIPSNIMDAAREYAKLYQPHDVFTMDLAQTPDGISIVEYNCWNASGLYHTDVCKIFHTVNEYKQAKIYENRLKPVL